MRFKGDIIITDPCYVMKKHPTNEPSMEDYEILKGKSSKFFGEFTKEENEAYEELKARRIEWGKENPNNWELCNYGFEMEKLGINNYLTRNTGYGGWSCTTLNSDTNDIIGEFCADSGLVSVFLLEEVLKYNPYFDYHTSKPFTTTLVKDFDGEVEIVYDSEKDVVQVIGKGNVNFITRQTGF